MRNSTSFTWRGDVLPLDKMAQSRCEKVLVVRVVVATLPHQMDGCIFHAAIVTVTSTRGTRTPHQWLTASYQWVTCGGKFDLLFHQFSQSYLIFTSHSKNPGNHNNNNKYIYIQLVHIPCHKG